MPTNFGLKGGVTLPSTHYDVFLDRPHFADGICRVMRAGEGMVGTRTMVGVG